MSINLTHLTKFAFYRQYREDKFLVEYDALITLLHRIHLYSLFQLSFKLKLILNHIFT